MSSVKWFCFQITWPYTQKNIKTLAKEKERNLLKLNSRKWQDTKLTYKNTAFHTPIAELLIKAEGHALGTCHLGPGHSASKSRKPLGTPTPTWLCLGLCLSSADVCPGKQQVTPRVVGCLPHPHGGCALSFQLLIFGQAQTWPLCVSQQHTRCTCFSPLTPRSSTSHIGQMQAFE